MECCNINVHGDIQTLETAAYHLLCSGRVHSCPEMRLRAHSSRQTLIARPGIMSSSLPLPHLAFPSSQSVSVTILEVLSKLLLSSACSIVWVAIRPFESKEKMNIPENSSPLLRLKMGLSPPSNLLRPLLMPSWPSAELPATADEFAAAFGVALFAFFFSVFHRTTSFSSPRSGLSSSRGRLTKPVLTIFSERMFNLTFPTIGTQPQATGAVHNAAL